MKRVFFVTHNIFVSLLLGCSIDENSTTPSNNSSNKDREESVIDETIYEVQTVDWLFGNWMEICNDNGCKKVDLHKTKLRGTIKENVSVKEVTTKIIKDSKSWERITYEYLD